MQIIENSPKWNSHFAGRLRCVWPDCSPDVGVTVGFVSESSGSTHSFCTFVPEFVVSKVHSKLADMASAFWNCCELLSWPWVFDSCQVTAFSTWNWTGLYWKVNVSFGSSSCFR